MYKIRERTDSSFPGIGRETIWLRLLVSATPNEGIFKAVASLAAKDEFSKLDKNKARGHENLEKCHCVKKDLKRLNFDGKTTSGTCATIR